MPLRSMTGFGAASSPWLAADGPVRVEVEVRSVNARFLELKMRQPFGPRVEQRLRKQAQARLGRGRVDLGVHLRRAPQAEVDDPLVAFGVEPGRVRTAARLLAQTDRLAAEEGLELRSSTAAELLRFLQVTTRAVAEALPEPPDFLDALVGAALDELCAFRVREGEALGAAIAELADALGEHADALQTMLPDEQVRLTERWSARIEELCMRSGVPPVEPERIAQEVAVLVGRADVAEELARIRSHLDQLRDVLAAEAAVGQGKTLDFVSQELLREFTTIGSKITTHAGSRIVIDAKGIIERVREQVQNVE